MNETSQPDTTYDVLVIGGGAAGENAADIATRGGLQVALIEHALLGGECSYWACMPSKALLRPGDALDALRRVPGVAHLEGEIDIEEALARRDALASHWDDSDQVEWLEGAGVDLIRGHGRIVGERQVEVTDGDGGTTIYEASNAVVVATGSSPNHPPIEGLDDLGVWDSGDATTAKEAPRRLLVIGGGVVGVEMAQAWKWLGSEEVTIVDHSDRLVNDEEGFAGEELGSALEDIGVTVHTDTSIQSLRRSAEDGPAEAVLKLSDGSTTRIEVEEVLVATGRHSSTVDVGVESVGLEPGEPIEVDERLRATGLEGGWLYAVGDVNGRSHLTHTGKYQARIAGAHIAGLDTTAWGDEMATPRVVFTSPELAAVGLTEDQARDRGLDIRTIEQNIRGVAGTAVLGRGYRGTCKLVIDVADETIVGATFVGPGAGEMLHAATIAIIGKVSLQTLWHAVPVFPTISEVWLRLLESYRDEFGAVFE